MYIYVVIKQMLMTLLHGTILLFFLHFLSSAILVVTYVLIRASSVVFICLVLEHVKLPIYH